MRSCFLALVLLAPLSAAAEGVLDAREAFRLIDASRTEAGLVITWDVAPGYALYRDRIRVATPTPGALAGVPFLPAGTMAADGLGGSAEEYLEPFTMLIPVTDAAYGHVSVRLQGCHMREPLVCFPPFSVDVPVEGLPGGFSPRR
ncbi:hypothetical protein RHOFW510R12_01165 [Rhodanobacter sp. FW510-R12]